MQVYTLLVIGINSTYSITSLNIGSKLRKIGQTTLYPLSDQTNPKAIIDLIGCLFPD